LKEAPVLIESGAGLFAGLMLCPGCRQSIFQSTAVKEAIHSLVFLQQHSMNDEFEYYEEDL
jgi:hypothetical protein